MHTLLLVTLHLLLTNVLSMMRIGSRLRIEKEEKKVPVGVCVYSKYLNVTRRMH